MKLRALIGLALFTLEDKVRDWLIVREYRREIQRRIDMHRRPGVAKSGSARRWAN